MAEEMELCLPRAAGESGSPNSGPVDRPVGGSLDSRPVDRPAGGSGSPDSGPVDRPAGGSSDSGPVDRPAGESGSPESGPVDRPAVECMAGPVQGWVMQQSAQELAAGLKADPCLEAKELDESIEEMLIRLDEFCAMLDMIRNDSSQILDENVPKIKIKALEMKKVYAKIDKMETFVKMVGQNAAILEQQVIQAEKDCGNLPGAVRKLLHSISAPSFLNKKSSCYNQQNSTYELPNLYRTEAYFPESSDGTYFSKPNT
ncbi:biogenesis of lysosome-related organelles complex 1 subunit 4-like [Carcharodon carcharias]|uniref:biogenesis of lysosome-related organelles complex 1 subunit 4-like n=1 Tax=Carcharodon carcharias TaxID=13397 RepID=UPI001B7F1A33|nr:biogenesis of lysosome-related organelles complex 1 subunit 4-like [Carcharodon carcharias]